MFAHDARTVKMGPKSLYQACCIWGVGAQLCLRKLAAIHTLINNKRRKEGVSILKQACSPECQGAQGAFKDSMIHGILQFTLRIAFRCVLHRCESQEIRCQKLFLNWLGRCAVCAGLHPEGSKTAAANLPLCELVGR